jgi:hypothetical protein
MQPESYQHRRRYLGSIHTFTADEQMLLQGVQIWSFWDHPEAVAFEVGIRKVVVRRHPRHHTAIWPPDPSCDPLFAGAGLSLTNGGMAFRDQVNYAQAHY